MKQIWKYPIKPNEDGVMEIKVPLGAQPLHVGLDPQGTPCIWFLVDPINVGRPILVYCYMTGEDIPDIGDRYYVGTFNKGVLVWHIFL